MLARSLETGWLRHTGGNAKWYQHSGKQFGGFLINMQLPYDPAIALCPFGCFSQRNKDLRSHKNLYTHVYSSFVHNSPKPETPQMSCYGWKVKNTAVEAYRGILLSKSMENQLWLQQEPGQISRLLCGVKTPVAKVYILYDSISITSMKGQNLDMENKSVVGRV